MLEVVFFCKLCTFEFFFLFLNEHEQSINEKKISKSGNIQI